VLPLLEQVLRLGDQCLVARSAQSYVVAVVALVGGCGRVRTLCCRGSVTCLFASNRPRRYTAWPRQRYRWTLQSSASFSDCLYRLLWVRQFLRVAGGARATAYRTCFLELMATAALPVVWVSEGVCVLCGRNASLAVGCALFDGVEVQSAGAWHYALAGKAALLPVGRETSELALLQLQQFPHNTFLTSFRGSCPPPFACHSVLSPVSHQPCRVNSVSAACPAQCAPQPCAQVLAPLSALPLLAATPPSRGRLLPAF
jgi:hypothetical protein